ncbi:MAG: hypothetical protein OXU20_17005 [Myxococcales bacterium]|nr:hypothetical protein [Myxococcales bacterium]
MVSSCRDYHFGDQPDATARSVAESPEGAPAAESPEGALTMEAGERPAQTPMRRMDARDLKTGVENTVGRAPDRGLQDASLQASGLQDAGPRDAGPRDSGPIGVDLANGVSDLPGPDSVVADSDPSEPATPFDAPMRPSEVSADCDEDAGLDESGDPACPECAVGAIQRCRFCGEQQCGLDGRWGPCVGNGGSSMCGNCGIMYCEQNGDYGPCQPYKTSEPCGCGRRYCGRNGSWGPCQGDGRRERCNDCGTRTCMLVGGVWSACRGTDPPQGCLICGTKTCGSSGWWNPCDGRGQTESCTLAGMPGTRTCRSGNWSSCTLNF